MASHFGSQQAPCSTGQVCCIIPSFILQRIVDSDTAHPDERVSAGRALAHLHALKAARDSFVGGQAAHDAAPHAMHAIVPPHMLQAIIDSDDASEEDKDRARKNLKRLHAIRAARGGADPAAPTAKRLYRLIYDAEESNELPGNRVRKEGGVAVADVSSNEVYDYFKKSFDFYYEVFKRNSIDDLGMSLVGSVHFDDEPGPPGFDNAFFDSRSRQMVFGDGDGTMFGSFTKSLDVIGHELTHGVTDRTAALPYHQQSGALNESMSDVFGSMIKQYSLKQTAEEADWLIGAELLLPGLHAKGLRSMKEPGTAFQNTPFGDDNQPAHMDGYVDLPDDDDPLNDAGGVHINSGIPNHAFFLVATALGGHSWDQAGPIWYKTLLDPKLRRFAAKPQNWDKCFRVFADLTCVHALDYGSDVQAVVKKAWTHVGVY
jgi:Zn-dependent metalloprotease